MPMIWMRMPGQSWPGAAASFLAVWTGMMVVMMLPSLVPALGRHRARVRGRAPSRSGWLTALVALAYFSVWIAVGIAVYPLGVGLTAAAMRVPALAAAAPLVTGLIVCVAGAIQLSSWKTRHLACWRDGMGHGATSHAAASSALRHGVRLGTHCVIGCAGLTASLLAVGMMDLRAMAAVTMAVTAERLAPERLQVARAVGVAALALGSLIILYGRVFI